jgi:lycopene cyclase domain-containing protein
LFTYTILNVVVVAILTAAVTTKIFISKRPIRLNWRRILILVLVLCALTAVFDSVLVGTHIVAYHSNHILGIYIGKAPLEDFYYTFVAALLIPCLWKLTGPNHEK